MIRRCPNRVIIRYSFNSASKNPFVVEYWRNVMEHFKDGEKRHFKTTLTSHVVGRYPSEDIALTAARRACRPGDLLQPLRPNTSISGQPPIAEIDGKADEQDGGGD
jgi:hypothetical protein